ncbi:hypothetical protein GGQ74_002436 [Desulfobaculum xiamenense]|uniref:Type II secretion system (T2SS), protein M n=1 Tax=Desulfobaculum xiamenense TaxID=995050 RepID=A0A846QQX0_9BACT|nr:hypothetical protein [Desulfobaculum xiamenense]NJB68763.1 hypothetical protein [Desulfobaculum xiamenense]
MNMPREQRKRLLVLVGAGLGLVLAVRFVALPLVEYRKDLSHRIQATERECVRVAEAAGEFAAVRADAARRTKGMKTGGKTLFAYLENVAARTKLRERVELMKPATRKLENGAVEQSVEMRLGGLFMDDLVRFLYEAETSTGRAAVRRMHVRKVRDRLDVDVVFVSVEGA